MSSQAPRAPQSDHTAALAVCEGHGAQALLPGTAQPSPGKGHFKLGQGHWKRGHD